ncbi:hypothetical protein GF352_03780 [archaeon]|nr:hypothetical protein [archaeon]
MNYLSDYTGDSKLERIIEKIRAKDEYKNCYLSDFEALQTSHWINSNLEIEDRVNMMVIILSLMDKDAGLYIDDFSTIEFKKFSYGVSSMLIGSEEGSHEIRLKYYNPNTNINKVKERLNYFDELKISSPSELLINSEGERIRITLINKEEAMSLGQIVYGPTRELAEFIEDPYEYNEKQSREVRDFLKNNFESIKNETINNQGLAVKDKEMKVIEEVQKMLRKEPDSKWINCLLKAQGVYLKNPFLYSEDENIMTKLTLYRYQKNE